MKRFNWGMIGYGAIAGKFLEAAASFGDATVAAVCGRNEASVRAFAAENGIERAYGSLERFLADDLLDAVYIAAPNSAHYGLAMACIEAGKPLLCEKPFMLDAAQARRVVDFARERKVFAAEGAWTKTLPIYKEIRALIGAGRIGEVRLITADYFYTGDRDPRGRLYDRALGGGVILDIGIYEIIFATMFLGLDPVDVASSAYIGGTGVDEVVSMSLRYADGAMAHLVCSFSLSAPFRASIIGTAGRIDVPEFGRAQQATAYLYRETPNTAGVGKGIRRNVPESEILELRCPHRVNGFEYQIAEVMECVRSGRTESALLPLDESLAQLEIVDRVRAQWIEAC